jgi:LytS/YehU family sensor histidine kinase
MIGLVEEDPARGIQFMEHLTEFYRGVLEIGEKEKIALSQEVELLKSYVHLLQERFGEAIDIVIEEHNSSGLIPPLTLQMLVENAVKHNVVSIHSPLHISIGRRDNYIIVKNNLNLKQGNSIASFGIGLSNIKSRYALLEADQVIIEQTDEFFEVKVPVIGP